MLLSLGLPNYYIIDSFYSFLASVDPYSCLIPVESSDIFRIYILIFSPGRLGLLYTSVGSSEP